MLRDDASDGTAPPTRPVTTPRPTGRGTVMIDGYNLALEAGTGVATYARNLSFACGELGYRTEILYGTRASPSTDPLLREISFFDSNAGAPSFWLELVRRVTQLATSPLGVRASEVPITGKVVTRAFQSRMPHYDRIWNAPELFSRSYWHFHAYKHFLTVSGLPRPDVMHWTYPLPLRLRGTRNIYTLHDLVPLRLPFTTLDNKKFYSRMIRGVLKRADHIITVSEVSKRDIVELFGYPEEKITNTYQAVSIPAKYANKSDDLVREEVEGAFGLTYKKYFLFFGAIEPKKNVSRLIEAYLASQVDEPLVVLGKSAWKAGEELRFLNEGSNRYLEQLDNLTFVRDRVRRFDYAPFPLLVSLIRGAKALVFPSLYEGFGLPVLEAMSLGTPVITSTAASIPEIAGDAAIMVDPYDPRAIADAIKTVSGDEALRARLSAAGVRQAALFSPERYRERLDKVYSGLVPQWAAAR
ncbi:glycosyltransferase family 4 protein [Ancylobacter sp. 6x-1]|uniref:Glycosyltransferase family 4 protein n=1 Tax=Ancylobacter crimeensis TaxID=2579147 RepID=A0ABT0DAM3_9HYPH|nr:glycosyltransferase family 1 protein [Ancylobacter crimeensis]MCK0197006.1 glycosyltransferase family 4 protein [Ancylobacter crimeensis]